MLIQAPRGQTATCKGAMHNDTALQDSSRALLVQCGELQAALLSNTNVSHSQDVLLKLLLSCKDLRAQVARHSAGQMTAVLRTQRAEHAVAFVSWLQRHAGLLQGLKLQLPAKLAVDSGLEPAVKALAGAMIEHQQHMQALQCFTLKSGVWAAGILQHVPTSLTRLDLDLLAAVKKHSTGRMAWNPSQRCSS